MKKGLITCALLCLSAVVMAQSSDNEDNVVKISESMHRAHRPGQVLVKFKDDSSISIRKQAPGRMRVSSQRVQSVLNQLGVTNMEQLMPIGGKVKMKPSERLRRANGKMMEDRDLSKLYLVDFNVHRIPSVQNAIEALQELEEVEFAEPNYLVYALGTPAETTYTPKARRIASAPAVFTPNDPMYEQQWGPAAINLPQFWATETQNVLGRRPVIAILDTGVDINHPDLKDNIWTNENELNGIEGEDDDLNGYKDDLHGWDCVNQTGRIGDWNGHGTHCAGIAAAVEGNGIGVVGANPDALIMPVTVLQSDGIGDVGTIIRGIEYTMKHQVDVISMSIGGYGYSIAYELALGKAYNRSVIVAAAGNDGLCIYPGHSCCSKPMFPGAFTFVLGVEASKDYAGQCFSSCGKGVYPYNQNPWRACFSNLDDDGPIFSSFDEEKIYNYELLVPGTNIISTYPGGRYKVMNGTSMATPLAAGAISRLLETKEYSSKELLFGDLIGTADANSKIMDVMAAYNVTDQDRKPTLMLVGYNMMDSVGGDNDKRFDAGEIIEIYPIMRNSWGEATGIKCSITTSENEDPEIIEILDNNVDFGRTLHSYGKEQSVNPIRFKINDNCVDGRHIRLTLNSTCENGTGETIAQNIVITAENGEELNGIMQKNTTLVAGKHYIINKSYAIPANLTLTLEPGTTLKFHDGAMLVVSDQARIRAIGTPDKPITFTKGDLSQGYVPTMSFNNNCVFQYCRFEMLSAEVNLISGGKFTDCIFKDCDLGSHGLTGMNTTRCNIIQNTAYTGIMQNNTHKNSNIIDNITTTHTGACNACTRPWYLHLSDYKDFKACNIYGNSIDFLRSYADIVYYNLEPTVIYTDYPSYWGSTKEDIVRKRIIDYYNELNDDVHLTTFGAIDLTNMLKQPDDQAHGIVWKILVDGVDAQDDYDIIPPLGVGTHRVDVYFNREMDTTVEPYVAMGVRPPYTQNFINENPSWSEDGKIYTAYITITAKSAFDGINRFYVSDAQDKDHFEIPVERSRFNVPVSAAGSKSIGFMAEAGLGRVHLTWNAIDTVDVEDVMGYNVYRYTMNEDMIASDTLRVNPDLIMLPDGVYEGELEFTDYDVVPGTNYYYYYRALRSTLDSTEPSLTVTATPLTSIKGDANGSMDVTVADIVSEIDYLTDQNPKPFIFEAADVNTDNLVNILDVVGTINIILGNTANSNAVNGMATAEYTVEDGLLYVECPVTIAGLQVLFKNENGELCCEPLEILNGMENVSSMKEDNCLFMSYSLRNRTIPAGRHAILRVGNAQVTGIILSDVNGHEVMAEYRTPTFIETIQAEQQVKPREGIFDMMGRKIQVPQRKGVYVIDGKKVCF